MTKKWKKNGKKAPSVVILKMEQNDFIIDESRRTYCWFRWPNSKSEDGVVHPKGVSPEPWMLSIREELNALNWSKYDDNTTVFVFDTKGEFICAKVSRRGALELGGKKGILFNEMRDLFLNVFWSKPDVSRGASRAGVGLSYKCMGWRLGYEPGANKLKEYTCNKDLPDEVVTRMKEGIALVTKRVEGLAKRVMNSLRDFDKFMLIKKFLNLPSVVGKDELGNDIGICTQIALASGAYWSNVHVDDDFFFTILSVLAGKQCRDNETIYTFNFPTFGVSIPMKSGDVIIFDSKVPHCSSNAKYEDDYIFSMYVSEKSVNCNAWIKYKEKNPREAAKIEDIMDQKKKNNKNKRKR